MIVVIVSYLHAPCDSSPYHLKNLFQVICLNGEIFYSLIDKLEKVYTSLDYVLDGERRKGIILY